MSTYSVRIIQNSHVNNIILTGDMREHLGWEVRFASWHVQEDTRLYTWHYLQILCTDAPTAWRRLIGSPKLQIIFHNRATKYRSLLRKMTYKDKGSYESSPPCTRRYASIHMTLSTYIMYRCYFENHIMLVADTRECAGREVRLASWETPAQEYRAPLARNLRHCWPRQGCGPGVCACACLFSCVCVSV